MNTDRTNGKRHPVLKVVGIVSGIVFLLVLVGLFFTYRAVSATGLGSDGVADYDTLIMIWENAADCSSRSKLDDMNINYNGNKVLSTILFGTKIVNSDYQDVERTVDTFTYLYEIKGGFEKETYEDEPYLIPYVCEDSDAAVIIIPGGGFGYKSMDGATGEGKDIALTLNENGISAFVLHYRSNPYEYPIPYLDVQRAVRYLRFHCEDFHLDPDKITLIGFSAGGNEIGTFINVIRGKNFFPEEYVPDEIDSADDSVAAASMIYPALSFRYNVPMLFCMFDDEFVSVLISDTSVTLQTVSLCSILFNSIFVYFSLQAPVCGHRSHRRLLRFPGLRAFDRKSVFPNVRALVEIRHRTSGSGASMCAENTDRFTTDIRTFKRCFNFRRTASPTNEYSVTGVENLHVPRVFRRERINGVSSCRFSPSLRFRR